MVTTAVDDRLLEAYQALNHREYIVAQQQYQQVLQGDMRNIDALLGMAVIAQQQGRDADAQAWDEKVLEVEPRNAIALSLMASYQANNDIIAEESKLKSMLVQQPEAASFHAALGNLYANQNQWQIAQEAFFNACRFAPNNADYAFNLAISLDHMAKYSLALEQYQRALKLLNLSAVASPDRAQLEVRVKALLSFNMEK
jgi:cytochrome c-type biogenesis protein CcmH/NrfG